MTATPTGDRLPPGSDGIPVLGETLSFVKQPFRFLEDRLAAHGRVFRTAVLGRKTAVIAGPEAATHFIDGNLVMREGSMPPHIQELFGGRSLPLLDGEIHRARKAVVNQAFTRAALTAYLPAIQSGIERYFAKWSGAGELRWLDELKRLAIEVICNTVIGMQPGQEIESLGRDYDTLTRGFATLPINIPGTKYRKALQARDRILAVLMRSVRERRAKPTDDGLSRILNAATTTGTPLSDHDAALELHHIVIAGFIVYAELGAIVEQLTEHPDVKAKLKAEVREQAASGPLRLEALVSMPYLSQFVSEVKRVTPIIPAVFGKAKQTFHFDGVSIPAGWMVMWALRPSHVAQSLYSDPERFDPDRFSPQRAEEKRHEHAFSPQGAGPVTGHRCPGLDFATYFMEVFAIVLLRAYAWQLPPQSFERDFTKTPPEPRDGLRAVVSK